MMIALLGGGAVFCFFMVFYFWMQYRREKKQVHEQFDQFAEIASQDRWSDRLADKLDETQWAKQLEPRLKRASIKIRPSEYGAILFMVGFSLVLFLYYGMGLRYGSV